MCYNPTFGPPLELFRSFTRTANICHLAERLLFSQSVNRCIWYGPTMQESPAVCTTFQNHCRHEEPPPIGPLALTAINVFVPLPQTKWGSHSAINITDRYSRPNCRIPTPFILSTHAAHIFSIIVQFGTAFQIIYFLRANNSLSANSLF